MCHKRTYGISAHVVLDTVTLAVLLVWFLYTFSVTELGKRNIFFEIHRQFGHTPSKSFASPGTDGDLDDI